MYNETECLEDTIKYHEEKIQNCRRKLETLLEIKSIRLSSGPMKFIFQNREGIIDLRSGGEYSFAAFYLSKLFSWKVKTDNFGIVCLIPTVKKVE